MEKIRILGIDIDKVDMKNAVQRCTQAIENNQKYFVVTPNAEIVVNAGQNKALYDIIKKADMVVPDGIGLVIGSKILRNPLKERVTGIDLMDNLLKYCNDNGKSIFLLGAKDGIAQKACENIKIKYKDIKIAGYHHGYYKGIHTGAKGNDEEKAVIQEINSAKPDILFVAFGSPKQEFFIDAYKDILNSKVFVGVGGSFDVYSGTVQRAPMFYQKHGLEWLYRVIKEPQRITRLGALPLFAVRVLFKRDKNKFSK